MDAFVIIMAFIVGAIVGGFVVKIVGDMVIGG
jgi:uncharacterized membrane protein YoaK (UPF0700 family)